MLVGDRIMAHNGPGTPLEPCALVRLEKPPDVDGISVWIVVYDSEPELKQLRAFPCTCSFCKGRV